MILSAPVEALPTRPKLVYVVPDAEPRHRRPKSETLSNRETDMASSLRRIAGQNVRIFYTQDGREVELIAVLPADRGLGVLESGLVIGVIAQDGVRCVMCWRMDGRTNLHHDDERPTDLVDLPPDLAVTPAPDGSPARPDVDAGEFAPVGDRASWQPQGPNNSGVNVANVAVPDPPNYTPSILSATKREGRREVLNELVTPTLLTFEHFGRSDAAKVTVDLTEARIVAAALREAGYGDQNP